MQLDKAMGSRILRPAGLDCKTRARCDTGGEYDGGSQYAWKRWDNWYGRLRRI